MSLRQKSWTVVTVIAVGIILLFFTDVIGLLVIAAGFLTGIILIKCPHCGVWLGKYPGEYCKNCGEKINWDKK